MTNPFYHIKSSNNVNVFWVPPGTSLQGLTSPGGWYFWDEVGGTTGPYSTEQDAIINLSLYAKTLAWGNP